MQLTKRISSLLMNYWFETADARAYVVLRIGYGISSLIHLILLWPLRREFFSPGGMFPQNNRFWLGEECIECMFLLVALVMIAQIIGLSPRFASIIIFLWHSSYSLLQPHEGFIRGLGLIIACSPGIHKCSVSSWLKARKISYNIASHNIKEQVPVYGLKLLQWQLIFLLANFVWSLFGTPYVLDGTFASYYLLSMFSRFEHPVPIFLEPASVIITYVFLGSALCVPFFLSIKQTFRSGIILTFIWSVIILIVSKWSVLLVYLFPTYLALWLGSLRNQQSLALSGGNFVKQNRG